MYFWTKKAKHQFQMKKIMSMFPIHCWKKKRDFQIIRSKVGGFLTQSVADNEYFVGWKENMVDKYHLKLLPIIC